MSEDIGNLNRAINSVKEYFSNAHATIRDTRALNIPAERNEQEVESNDPNDPRNWAAWHKGLTFGTICLFSFMANVNASAFTVAVRPLMMAFHINATQATAVTALNVLMFGLGNLIWVPMMRVVGKRPVYLIAIAILIATNAWSATAASWGSLLASRMLSGVAAAAADAPVPSACADLWNQEFRGSRLMLFHFSLASGIFLGPLINAWVIQLHGWRWAPGWMAIIFGVILILAIFLLHETEYRMERVTRESPYVPARLPFKAWLGLTRGLQRREPIKVVVRTFKDIILMIPYTPILWSAMLIGLFVGWTIIIQITVGQLLTQPPYRFQLGFVGLFHFSGFLGIVAGFFFGGILTDILVKRRRTGSRLAKVPGEARLPALVVPFLIAPVGLIIYGLLLSQKKSWIGPAFGYAMHSFGFVAVSNIVVAYAVDGYTTHAGEGLVSLFIIRNAIGVICSFYCNPWLQRDGMPKAFGTMAGLEWAFMLIGGLVYGWNQQLLRCTRTWGPAKREEDKRKAESAVLDEATRDRQRLETVRPETEATANIAPPPSAAMSNRGFGSIDEVVQTEVV